MRRSEAYCIIEARRVGEFSRSGLLRPRNNNINSPDSTRKEIHGQRLVGRLGCDGALVNWHG